MPSQPFSPASGPIEPHTAPEPPDCPEQSPPGRVRPPVDDAAEGAVKGGVGDGVVNGLVDDVMRSLAALPTRIGRPSPPRLLLGLCGPPAAGKSTLAAALVAGIEAGLGPGTAALLPLDGFHLSNTQLQRLGLTDRKGSPPSFDVQGYLALLLRVRGDSGVDGASAPHDIYAPDYDRTLHEPIAARHVIAPGVRVVVTEGNYLGLNAPGWREAADLLDQLWYVEAPDGLREQRLGDRHQGNGSSVKRARLRVETNDRPNGELVRAAWARSPERYARVVQGV